MDKWFTIDQIDEDTYIISEYRHWEETHYRLLVIALGAGLGIWGVINLMEGYGNDNPGANAHVR